MAVTQWPQRVKPAFTIAAPLYLRNHHRATPTRPITARRVPQTPQIRMTTKGATIHVGDVPNKLAELVHAKATAAIASTGHFNVAISGGSLPKLLAEGLQSYTVDLAHWRVFLADERIVALDDVDSNYREISARFPDMHIRPIDPELAPADCALAYQQAICDELGEQPTFDAVLLGLGPDGHTCSLFAEHPLLEVDDRSVAFITDSPKPPPARVTLTLPVLNQADAAIFVCTGASKADVVTDILENPASQLPGALVRPADGAIWLLDEGAASGLSPDTTS